MSKVINFRQCRLRRENTHQTSYLPEKYAINGKVLKLRDEAGTWENGWVVVSAGSLIPENLLPDHHVLIKGHRKATGDSLPK